MFSGAAPETFALEDLPMLLFFGQRRSRALIANSPFFRVRGSMKRRRGNHSRYIFNRDFSLHISVHETIEFHKARHFHGTQVFS